MAKITAVTLKLDPQGMYRANFLENVREVSGNEDILIFDYSSLDEITDKIKDETDIWVFSPGDARIGLDTDERHITDPYIRPLYALIDEIIDEGKKKIIGINAGHLALHSAQGLHIDNKLPEGYKGEHQIDLTGVDDPIAKGIGRITVNLTNDFAVTPGETTPRVKVEYIVDHMGHPLISRFAGSDVIGVQFNIQPGTKELYRNIFNSASR